MSNGPEIHNYTTPITTPSDESEFDLDYWTGAAFSTRKITWANLNAAVTGTNIGNADLTSSVAARSYTLFGDTASDELVFKNNSGFNSLVINGAGDVYYKGFGNIGRSTCCSLD